MLEFAASRGILLIASPPYTQKLNPVEGMIKILIRMALAMLRHAGAPKSLIEYSLSHATLLLNRLPRQKKGSGIIVPLNLWLGVQPPSILHKLKIWGCAAYALVMGNRSKFDSKVTRQVHLGYDVARSAYVLCSLPHFKISYSAHVTFNEEDFPMRGQFKPDPEPSRLLEENPGPLLKHHAGGEVWGQGHNGDGDAGADAVGRVPNRTLGLGTGLERVYDHPGAGGGSKPLERGLASRPDQVPLERGGSEKHPGEARLEHLWKGVSQATHLLWFKGGWSNPWQGMSQAPGFAGPRGDGSPPVVASKILLTCAMIWRGWSQS